jgi:hypothetical protein
MKTITKRSLIVLTSLVAIATGSLAQAVTPQQYATMLLLQVGGPGSTPPAYTGPGDTLATNSLTGFVAYGLQAYSAATRGSKLAQVCNSTGGTDVLCVDMLSDASTGKLVPQTLSGLSCPGSVNCTVRIWYDLIGTACTGGCDILQTSPASRATLSVTVGGNACEVFTSASTIYGPASLLSSLSQPFGAAGVVQRTSAFTTTQNFIGDSTNGDGFGFANATNSATNYTGTGFNASGVTDNQPHAYQALANGTGTSSNISVDGTTTTGSSGTAAFAGGVRFGTDVFSNRMNGYICAAEVYSGSAANITASQAGMNSTLHTNWGF